MKPTCLFDVSKDEELREAFKCRNTQTLLKKDKIQMGRKYKMLDYSLQFVRVYNFIKLNEEVLIKTFIDEIYSTPPRKNCPTSKIFYKHIDEIWSFDIADLSNSKFSNDKGFRFVFVKIDKFSNYTWDTPIKQPIESRRNSKSSKYFKTKNY